MKSCCKSGFTLTELLVVILIIALMSSLVLTAVSGGGSEDLDAGVSRFTNVFTLAQSAAITRKTPVRVAICYDPGEEDYFLKYANIFYFDEEAGGETWKPLSEGESLPAGIFFSPGLSTPAGVPSLKLWTLNFNFNSLSVISAASFLTSARSTLNGDENDGLNRAGSDQWVVYEFAPNGTATSPGTRMVLTEGLLPNPSGPLVIPNPEKADGFVLFRAGRPYHFQDPRQIEGL
jgi:prepilin-type N-terminal cleavage/methylation domain-containing protein